MRLNLRLIALFGLIVAALTLSGCKPKNGDCDTTDDCKAQDDYKNDVCVDKKCKECGADTDCKAGFLCQENKCVPKPECAKNEDCGTGKLCKNAKCVSGCVNDAGCGGGKCVNGQCKPPGSCSGDSECPSGQKCVSGFCQVPDTGGPSACELKRVNFDFNESTLTDAAQTILKDDASCIQQRKLSVTLEGNADERGTEEYNLHLGERRAASAKKYLQSLGVEPGKMKTISYGKERPINPGHDEAAWAENRRVDVVEQ
jgi:peptidoglycan-associated lipoprotein